MGIRTPVGVRAVAAILSGLRVCLAQALIPADVVVTRVLPGSSDPHIHPLDIVDFDDCNFTTSARIF